MNRKLLLVGLFSAMMVPGALAVWIGGLQVELTGQTVGGTQPQAQLEVWSIPTDGFIPVGCNTGNDGCGPEFVDHVTTLNNPDGIADLTLTCDDLSVSNDPACKWSPGTDIKVQFRAEGNDAYGNPFDTNWQEPCGGTPATVSDLPSGDTTLRFRAITSGAMCPSDAVDITLYGDIVPQ